jgi:tRNA(His) 5'-end guanylyltransferase
MDAMVTAASRTAKEMAGFKIAYTQSDEVTFLLTDFDEFETEPWFGNKLNKLVSISASIFTAHFNSVYQHPKGLLATFDSRAFVVPRIDAPNVFVWRQMDWHRNSLLMLAQSKFSHKELQGKKAADLHDMLHGIGVNWAKDLSQQEKNGTFIYRDKRQTVGQYFCYQTLKYQDIDELITEIMIYDEYR